MDEMYEPMEIVGEEDKKTSPRSGRKILTTVIVVIIVAVLILVSLIGTNIINIGGVTMRELQLDYNNENHNYRHYNEGDTVTLVDRITSLEVKSSWRGDYTVLEFSAKPLPTSWDIESGSAQVEDWFTYVPDSFSRPIRSTFHGDISVDEDISDRFKVGDKVKIVLHFTSIDVAIPITWDEDPYTTELISETIAGISIDEITKV